MLNFFPSVYICISEVCMPITLLYGIQKTDQYPKSVISFLDKTLQQDEKKNRHAQYVEHLSVFHSGFRIGVNHL